MIRSLVLVVGLFGLWSCTPGGGGGTGGGSGGGAFGGGFTGAGGGSTGGGRTGGGGGSTGGGGGGGGGGGSGTAGLLTLARLGWERAAVVSGSNGAIHLLYVVGEGPFGVEYATCASGCDVAANWSFALIEQGTPTIGRTRLAIGADGRLHARYDLDGSQPVYATCAGNCAQVSSWQKVNLGSVLSGTTAELWGEPLVVDATGRVYFVTSDQRFPADIRLNTCAANCTQASSWESGLIRTDGRKSSLAVQGTTLHHLINNGQGTLVYRTCSANCTQAASWTESPGLFAHNTSQPTALTVSPQGVVRVAYNQGMANSGESAQVKAQDDKMLFWECSANCMQASSWGGVVFAANQGQRGLDMASAGTSVVIAHAQETTMSLTFCESGCTDGARWQTADVDSQQKMEADVDPYTVTNCTNTNTPPQFATWFPEEPSVTILPSGATAVTWGMWMNRQCPGGVLARRQGYGRFLFAP